MTAQEFAKKLNGREYGSELSLADEVEAARSRLLVILGYGFDVISFHGAGRESGTWFVDYRKDVKIEIDADGVIPLDDKSRLSQKTLTIAAKFADGAGNVAWSWYQEPDAPAFQFGILDEGEFFSRGIVLSLDDVAGYLK